MLGCNELYKMMNPNHGRAIDVSGALEGDGDEHESLSLAGMGGKSSWGSKSPGRKAVWASEGCGDSACVAHTIARSIRPGKGQVPVTAEQVLENGKEFLTPDQLAGRAGINVELARKVADKNGKVIGKGSPEKPTVPGDYLVQLPGHAAYVRVTRSGMLYVDDAQNGLRATDYSVDSSGVRRPSTKLSWYLEPFSVMYYPILDK